MHVVSDIFISVPSEARGSGAPANRLANPAGGAPTPAIIRLVNNYVLAGTNLT